MTRSMFSLHYSWAAMIGPRTKSIARNTGTNNFLEISKIKRQILIYGTVDKHFRQQMGHICIRKKTNKARSKPQGSSSDRLLYSHIALFYDANHLFYKWSCPYTWTNCRNEFIINTDDLYANAKYMIRQRSDFYDHMIDSVTPYACLTYFKNILGM